LETLNGIGKLRTSTFCLDIGQRVEVSLETEKNKFCFREARQRLKLDSKIGLSGLA
jgi:hypothetical protein